MAIVAAAGLVLAEPIAPAGIATGIFGLEASGNRFVYVFDRSASMGEPAGRPLARAKKELLASIGRLGGVQQFYVVFYNHRQHVFNASDTRQRLVFATDDNKEAARRFIGAVRPDGGTRHREAIATGLRLRPDVMFVLTDGEPGDDLTDDELEALSRDLAGTTCMVVQFGGAETSGSPNLARLAKLSGGRYAVIDPSAE
jgi:hypothetical protein